MNQPKIVSIGGLEYDSRTGLPATKSYTTKQPVVVATNAPKKARDIQPVHATGIHATPQQRSATLTRRYVAKSSTSPVILHPKTKNMDIRPNIARSAHISKFASEPQAHKIKRPVVSDIAPRTHPIAKRAHDTQTSKQQVVAKPAHSPSSKDIKHAELGKALAHAKTETKAPKPPRRRALNIAAASLGLLLIAGYFTYVNMPNLSVRVAAAQAGIDATFPEYRPIGYTLNGPVSYQDGEVSMKFTSNTGPVAFSLKQSKSSWDSAALLEKYVNPESESKYATYTDGGLTIYTYGTNAAWVNGGILYTIDGSANLSNEQIRRIASSM